MDELVGALFVLALVVGAIIAVTVLVLSTVWVALVGVAYHVLRAGDILMGAALVPSAPWAMWSACGLVLGAALGLLSDHRVLALDPGRRLAVLVVPLLGLLGIAVLAYLRSS